MFRSAVVALAALAVATPALAAEPSLVEILAKHYEANGGLARMKQVESRRMTGKMIMGHGMEAPFVMEFARPDRFRLEFTVQGMTGVRAFDGETGWTVMPFMGKSDPEEIPAEALDEMREVADFDGPLVDWKAKGHKVRRVGKEPVDGADAWHLTLTRKDGRVRHIWLDAESWLELRSEGKRTLHGGEVEVVTSLGAYREVEGLMFAHTMSQAVSGAPGTQQFVVEKIELNPKLDPARFVMPPKPATTADSTTATPAGGDTTTDATTPGGKRD